jgi:hypothetical protein
MQQAATIAMITLAAAYIVRSLWRTLAGKKVGCGAGCGKCAAPAPEPIGRISLPQV